jgi:hypothetical protein
MLSKIVAVLALVGTVIAQATVQTPVSLGEGGGFGEGAVVWWKGGW